MTRARAGRPWAAAPRLRGRLAFSARPQQRAWPAGARGGAPRRRPPDAGSEPRRNGRGASGRARRRPPCAAANAERGAASGAHACGFPLMGAEAAAQPRVGENERTPDPRCGPAGPRACCCAPLSAESAEAGARFAKALDVLGFLVAARLGPERGGAAVVARAGVGAVDFFTAERAPGVSIRAYLERLLVATGAPVAIALVLLIYLDRLVARTPELVLLPGNIHRFLLLCFVEALKVNVDHPPSNAYQAKVGGVSAEELASLEIVFLRMIGCDLHVTEEVFGDYFEVFAGLLQEEEEARPPESLAFPKPLGAPAAAARRRRLRWAHG